MSLRPRTIASMRRRWLRRRAQHGTDFAAYDRARDDAWVIVERLRNGLPPVPADELPTPNVNLTAGETQLTAAIPAAVFRWHHPEGAPPRPGAAAVPTWTAAQTIAARRAMAAREQQWRTNAADAAAAYWEPYGHGDQLVAATTHRLIINPATTHQVDLWWQHLQEARQDRNPGSLVLSSGGNAWWIEGDEMPQVTALAVWQVHQSLLRIEPASERKYAAIVIAEEAAQRAVDAMFGSTPSG